MMYDCGRSSTPRGVVSIEFRPSRTEEATMLAKLMSRVTVFTLAVLLLPASVCGGAFYIDGQGIDCWCDARIHPRAWNTFPVWFVPADEAECSELVGAAFRIEGVSDDPALMRRFEHIGVGTMAGDVFADGAVFRNLDPLPGETIIGWITLYVTESLDTQVWSVEAHRGIEGTDSPVVEFGSARGEWLPQPGHSIEVASTQSQCATCEDPRLHSCPFAVAPRTWSNVKRVYQ